MSIDNIIYPYGMCPTCGAPGFSRERRPNGNDTCENGHVYQSCAAVGQNKKTAAPQLLDYAQVINSLAFLTDEQRAGFFALLGASYCLTCGSLADQCRCESDVPPPWSVYPAGRVE